VSFKCGFCGNTSKPREKMRLVPVELRDRTYQNGVTLTFGTEIVKEHQSCEGCYQNGTAVTPV
jgi:hypothetical protein